jgi:F0F1-type ATP synthase delta subunit
MTNVNIKSVLEQIAATVFTMTNVADAKNYISEFINSKDINDKDKASIVRAVAEIKSMLKLQTYLCNALLKYEGMGMNKINKQTAAAETAAA